MSEHAGLGQGIHVILLFGFLDFSLEAGQFIFLSEVDLVLMHALHDLYLLVAARLAFGCGLLQLLLLGLILVDESLKAVELVL